MSVHTTEPALPLVAHLGLIIGNLRATFANHTGHNRAIAPLVLLIWTYLGRIAPRLERLIAALQAGRLTPPRKSAPRATPAAPANPPRLRLPTGNAWLVKLAQRTAQFSGQLEALLARPEMAELLATAPQAGRILRPLFRMLGCALPPVLRRPNAPPPAPTRPAPRRHAPPPAWTPPPIRQPGNLDPPGPVTSPWRSFYWPI